MPANRCNFVVFYLTDSQIYGTASRDIALAHPPPTGATIEDKRICFITYQPDNEILSVHPLPLDEIRNADIEPPKPTKKKKVETDNEEA